MFLDVSHTTQPAVAETSSSKASVREHVRYQQAAPGYILATLCRVLYERPTNCGTVHGQLAIGFAAGHRHGDRLSEYWTGQLTKPGALYRIAYAQPDALARFAQWHPFLK